MQPLGLPELNDYAARIGADPALVQGAGGNVSLKCGGVLWVKASGTWLARATDHDIMVPVALDPLLAAIAADDAEAMEGAYRFVVGAGTLRPSIETTMHALLPHPVVVHVHCVETIARAVRTDAGSTVAPFLHGLAWAFVPYVRPGAPLARAIRDVLQPGLDVLILGNHGLVVGAATVAGAAALLADVSRRLRATARPALLDSLATDPLSLSVARQGSLYPDHVIFLGPGIQQRPGRWPMQVVPGVGVRMAADASAGAWAMAQCLADVAARIPADTPLRVLTHDEEAELLGWDAEQYRQRLER